LNRAVPYEGKGSGFESLIVHHLLNGEKMPKIKVLARTVSMQSTEINITNEDLFDLEAASGNPEALANALEFLISKSEFTTIETLSREGVQFTEIAK
jgi:hypothetical protein